MLAAGRQERKLGTKWPTLVQRLLLSSKFKDQLNMPGNYFIKRTTSNWRSLMRQLHSKWHLVGIQLFFVVRIRMAVEGILKISMFEIILTNYFPCSFGI